MGPLGDEPEQVGQLGVTSTTPVPSHRRTAESLETLLGLHQACRAGNLHEVEQWIRQGNPIQLSKGSRAFKGGFHSALHIALASGQYSLVDLLLSHGYRFELERKSPFDLALEKRRPDLVDLLLQYGADPKSADPFALFESHTLALFERFRATGYDLTKWHALASCLGNHTSNRPLFGFVKRHRLEDPAFQNELNLALGEQVRRGNERGVELCLWAGAEPHVPAVDCESDEASEDQEPEGEPDLGSSAVEYAARFGQAEILRRLGPDVQKDNFEDLYQAVSNGDSAAVLLGISPPKDVSTFIIRQTWWLKPDLHEFGHRPVDVMERVFNAGIRWEVATHEEIREVRRKLLEANEYDFVRLLRLLCSADTCSDDILRELGRTPAMKARLKLEGFLPADEDDGYLNHSYPPVGRRHVLQRFGLTPQPKQFPLPEVVRIGAQYPAVRTKHMTREKLFDLIWQQPVDRLARSWGLSGVGLAKACRRLRIPLPPRGYWAGVRYGRRGRRPRLPSLREGEAREVVIHVRSAARETK